MLKRKILTEIKKYYFEKEIVILIGARQVWKSTLLKMVEKELVKNNYWVFFDTDFDNELLDLKSSKDLLDLLELSWFSQNNKEKFIVFIDEFQKIRNIWTIIKWIYDRFDNIKFFLSGSSSILINKAFWDSIMWRKVVFNIERLDFEEFLEFKKNDKLLKIYNKIKLGQNFSIHRNDFEKNIENFIIFWWYPQIVLSNKIDYKIKKLEEIVLSYIKKDIWDFFNIEHSNNIVKLLKYITQINSNLLKKSAIWNDIWISDYNLGKYLSVLKETFFIKELWPFFKNKIKTISKSQEIFFSDTWIYNSLLKVFSPTKLRIDKWVLIENFVFTELSKTKNILDELFFYRDNNQLEVDFIIKRWDLLLPIEVKAWNYDKIPLNLINFSKKNWITKAVLLNKGVFKTIFKENIEIIYIPYFLTWRLFDILNN